MLITEVETGSSKLKPVYPYFARRYMAEQDTWSLCLIHKFGAVIMDEHCSVPGDTWTWIPSEADEREADFEPLPVGSQLLLENT